MVGDTAQKRVRDEVLRQMAESRPPVSRAALAERSGIAPNTVSNFLNGKTWPQPAKLSALERALGLPVGHLERIARGETPDANLGRSDETGQPVGHVGDDLVIGLTPGALRDRSAAERDRILAAAKLAALRELDEIDRARGRNDPD